MISLYEYFSQQLLYIVWKNRWWTAFSTPGIFTSWEGVNVKKLRGSSKLNLKSELCNHVTASLATDLVAEMLPFQPEICRECWQSSKCWNSLPNTLCRLSIYGNHFKDLMDKAENNLFWPCSWLPTWMFGDPILWLVILIFSPSDRLNDTVPYPHVCL